MPYKTGGGDKLQLYNSRNGEYIRNPICEQDEENLVMQKLFGVNTNKKISYPIKGIHDEDYLDLIIKYCLDYSNPQISDRKLTDYLLVPQPKKDKSKILNSIGYDINNFNELKKQLLIGSNFKRCYVQAFTETKLLINVETKLYNKKNNKYYYCTTAWFVETNFTLRFVTLIPEVYSYEKN